MARAGPMVAFLNLRLRNSRPIAPIFRRMASGAPVMSAETDQTSLHEKVKAKQEAKKKADVPLGMRESFCVGQTCRDPKQNQIELKVVYSLP